MASQPRPLRFPTAAHLEHIRRGAECAGVGLVWALFSLPVVTAGAAWIAAATIFAAWARREEPPVFATFARVVPRQLGAGLAGELTAAVIIAVVSLDVRFALAARVPGAWPEAALLAVLGAAALAIVLLAAHTRADSGGTAGECIRAALTLCTALPWVLPLLVTAVGVAAVLIALVPAFALVLAGPVSFAVCAVATRARRAMGS